MAQSSGPPDLPPPPWRTTAKKQPRARVAISQDLIVETAIRVLDAEGLDAVSMRRVAQELETGAASLYAHVANKKELLDLVFDRIVGEIELPAPGPAETWREQIRELGVTMHATLSAHADVARVMSQAPARIAGLEGHGGTLAVGQPANITLVDPDAVVVVDRDTSASLSRNNPWHERKLTGAVTHTFLRGVPTVVNGELA